MKKWKEVFAQSGLLAKGPRIMYNRPRLHHNPRPIRREFCRRPRPQLDREHRPSTGNFNLQFMRIVSMSRWDHTLLGRMAERVVKARMHTTEGRGMSINGFCNLQVQLGLSNWHCGREKIEFTGQSFTRKTGNVACVCCLLNNTYKVRALFFFFSLSALCVCYIIIFPLPAAVRWYQGVSIVILGAGQNKRVRLKNILGIN